MKLKNNVAHFRLKKIVTIDNFFTLPELPLALRNALIKSSPFYRGVNDKMIYISCIIYYELLQFSHI